MRSRRRVFQPRCTPALGTELEQTHYRCQPTVRPLQGLGCFRTLTCLRCCHMCTPQMPTLPGSWPWRANCHDPLALPAPRNPQRAGIQMSKLCTKGTGGVESKSDSDRHCLRDAARSRLRALSLSLSLSHNGSGLPRELHLMRNALP